VWIRADWSGASGPRDHDPPWWTRSVPGHLGPRSVISLRKPLCEEEEGWETDGNVVGVIGNSHQSGLLGEPSRPVLVKVPGRANRNRLHIVDEVFDKGEEMFVVVRVDVGRD